MLDALTKLLIECGVTWQPRELAKKLIERDVIVPPCKVGDKVFFIDTCITAEDFGKKFVTFETVKSVSLYNKLVHIENGQIRPWKDVFLTKEEAEKALKDGDK